MSLNFSNVKDIEIPITTCEQLDYIYFNGTDNYMTNLLCNYPTIEFELLKTTGTQVIFEVHNTFYSAYVNGTTLYVIYGRYGQGVPAHVITNNIQSNVKYRLVIQPTGTDTIIIVSLYQGETLVSEVQITADESPSSTTPCNFMCEKLDMLTYRNFANCKLYSYTVGGVLYVPYIDKATNIVGLCRSDNFNKTDMSGTINSQSIGNVVFPGIFPRKKVIQIKNAQNVILWRGISLVSIALSGQTTDLEVGDSFSFGGTVTATYSDGTTANVTSSTTFSGYNMSTAGTYTVTASYTDWGITATSSYQLTVHQPTTYRRLQYIQSTGTQAFDTGVKAARNSYMKLIIEDMDTNDSPNGRGAVQNNQRFGAGYRTNNNKHYFRFGIGSGWLDGPERSSGPHTIGVQGPECSSLTGGGQNNRKQGYYIDGTFTQNSNTFPASNITWYSLYLLGSRGNTSGSIQEPCLCKMYYAEYGYTRTDNYQQGYNRRYYPVQRKSDNKLGFYDIVNNTFLNSLVSGSDSNTLVAGPVADEWWDLTAPD